MFIMGFVIIINFIFITPKIQIRHRTEFIMITKINNYNKATFFCSTHI